MPMGQDNGQICALSFAARNALGAYDATTYGSKLHSIKLAYGRWLGDESAIKVAFERQSDKTMDLGWST